VSSPQEDYCPTRVVSYPLMLGYGYQTALIPQGSEILHFAGHYGCPMIWVKAKVMAESVDLGVTLFICPDNADLPEEKLDHIGTSHINGIVMHLFRRPE